MAAPIEWIRMILKNHIAFLAIWAAISGIAGYQMYRDIPDEPNVIKLPLPAIRVIEDKPYNEIVSPTHKPHTHPEISKEIDDKLNAHKNGSLH